MDDLSLSLEQGDHALLLGPSGSGKSTLLNIICGLQQPDKGVVYIDGDTIADAGGATSADAVRRKSLGIVFQTLRLVSALSLRANLELAQRLQCGSVDSAAIDESLERLDIAHRADAKPHQLSQGEAQRAAIARAVVVKPRLLIADEPTSALDGNNAERVAQLLLDMAESIDASLLIATHDERLQSFFPSNFRLAEGKVSPC
ncbi:ABC transporter ATP-binding protein [Alterisphingorhabdus coralli]|uniref:ATP-binding cassette domain-containing protein n=1 Tax=Alterisphingorhabdus coralli TaxID=3071408 RepID=A0AA97F4H3_9SPHN|nr:ATP-binding cassette domain-containing protein [Parasphingorhabdus sp. SCSIO 66989]WOE73873.1 ATP-binding cassette domain-containing protein [Parasphingorhabdus sp. SCSIO 66989]